MIRNLKRSLVLDPPQNKVPLRYDNSINGVIVELMQQKASLQQMHDLDSKKTNKADSDMMLQTIGFLHQQLYLTTVVLCEVIEMQKDPSISKIQFTLEHAQSLAKQVRTHNPIDLGNPVFLEPKPLKLAQKRLSLF